MKRTQLLLFGAWMSALVFAGCADGPSCPPGTRKIGTRCIRLATDDAGLDASVSNVGASDQDASSAEAGAPDRGVVCSEGEPQTLYRDADGDGFGSSESIQACEAREGYVEQTGDCDDAAPNVHPGAPDLCNGIDDDCNPATDDGLASCNGFRCDGVKCGNGCEQDEDCVTSLRCLNNACYGTLAVGEPCEGDIYCESKVCECANEDCSEKRCTADRCPNCTFVSADGMECSGAINGVEHGDCAESSMCVAGACKLANGRECTEDQECLSGSCGVEGKCQERSAVNGACNSDGDCADGGATCVAGKCKLTDGAACSEDGQCKSTSCFVVCRAPASQGEPCDSAPDCATPLVCGNAGRCALPNGHICSADAACGTGSCGVNGKCSAPVGLGQACNSAPDCQTSLACIAGKCLATNGAACTRDEDCSSGSCSPSKACQPPGGMGQICNSYADCIAPLICDFTTANGPEGVGPVGYCRLPAGASCKSGLECAGAVENACSPQGKCRGDYANLCFGNGECDPLSAVCCYQHIPSRLYGICDDPTNC